jgi:hypothetical protein
MICYKHHYQVKKPLEVVFNYFLKKEYLTKGYNEKTLKNISIKSTLESDFIQPNEIIKILQKVGDHFLELEIHVLEIKKNAKIVAKLSPGNVYFNNGAINHLESDDFKKITKTNKLRTEFKLKKGFVEIIEYLELENPNFFDKIKWPIIRPFVKFLNSKTNKKIQEELENLKNK